MELTPRVPIRQSPDWAVWRGEEAGTRQLFLVKEVNPRSPYPAPLAARLRDEYRFLAPLDHPNLVKPVWADPAGTRAAFTDVQCNLAEYVTAHGPVAPTLVANVLAAAADALEYLHARRLGHGAVSCHSLLVGPAGEVLFGDFLGYEFGTNAPLPVPDPEPRYQAPELIDATLGKPGPAADLYCLGFVALELLAGERFERLFGLPDRANWLAWHADPYKQLADWQPALGHAPGGLLRIVAGLIAKRPGDRAFASGALLKAALVRGGLTSELRFPAYRPDGVDVPSGKPPVEFRRPPVRARTGSLPKGSAVKPVLTLHPLGKEGGEPRTFPPAVPVLAGRGREVAVRCDEPGVSRKHALLACGPDGVWRVYDLKTPAGTYLNGTPVGRARLYPDDELYLAGCGFRVELGYRPTGRTFDQFRLLSQLHAGRRGRVFRAVWTAKGNRPVAVRIFPKDFQFDPAGLRRLLRGTPEAARARHPHLVRAYRCGAERFGPDRAWFVASEYLPGGSLRDRLRRGGRLPDADALRVVRQVADGADALARIGWVHRNINPGCVLFDAAGRAKLGDFFFARAAVDVVGGGRDATSGGDPAFAPDPAYQAPECRAGEARLTPACDVYSIGATAVEALTGRPPAGGRSDPGRGVGGPVGDLLRRATAADPGDRFDTPGELARAAARLEAEYAPAGD